MTLIMARADQRGAWVCTDRRTVTPDGAVLSDQDIKLFAFALNRGHVLGAVSGFYSDAGGTVRWYERIANALPLTATRDEMLEAFRSAMEAQLTGLSQELDIGVTLLLVGTWDGAPLCYGIQNWPDFSRFTIEALPWRDMDVVTAGWDGAIRSEEFEAVGNVLRTGRKPLDAVEALAALNRTASGRPEAEGNISPACVVAFWSPDSASFPVQWAVGATGQVSPLSFVTREKVPVALLRPNDGRKVKLTAKHEKTGYSDSALTVEVIVDPWETTATVPADISNAPVVLTAASAEFPDGDVLAVTGGLLTLTDATIGLDPDDLAANALGLTTDLVMLWSGGLGVTLELDGIKRGRLALQYSTDASTWDFVDGISGPFVSLQTAGMQRGAQATPQSGFTDATADVALRVVKVDESDTATAVGVFPRLWKFPTGIAAVRIGAEVVTAGEFDVDPVIANVWIEFSATAAAVDPPADGDLPQDPSPIETTDLVHWYQADAGIVDDGSGGIATWENQVTGSDLTATGGSGGLQVDGSLTAVRFGAVGTGYFQFPSGEFTGRTAGHLFMLVRSFTLDHAASNSGFFDLGTGNSQYGWGGNLLLDYGTDALKTAPMGAFDITQWHVLEIETDGTTYIVRLNGTEHLNTTNASVAWSTVGKIGASNPGGGIYGDYLLYEFIEYSTRQSSTVAGNVRDWLYFRGGITL